MAGAVPRIEGFDDLAVLGRGGFSTVYSGVQTDLGRRVAVKVLNIDVAGGAAQRRFERECRIVGILSGVPGIVAVHQSAFTLDGRPCIVMELMEGGSLEQFVKKNGPLGHGDVLQLADVLCSALAEAHSRGVAHRDVKPANVLLSGDGQVALADFGIAMVAHLASSTQTVESLSPPYSPPERLISGEVDEQAADLYSLGATLYFALCGTPPFGTARDGGVSGLVRRVMNDRVPAIDRSDVSVELVALVEQLLDKRADRRPHSAATALDRIREVAGQAAQAPDAEPPAPERLASAQSSTSPQPVPTKPVPTPPDSPPEIPPLSPTPRVNIPAPPSGGAPMKIPIPEGGSYWLPVERSGSSGPPGPWPTAVDYVRAIQDPAVLVDPGLVAAGLERDLLGMPVSAAGQSAVVFQLSSQEGPAAVRFFTRAPLEGSERYDALASHVKVTPCPAMVPARWIHEAIDFGGVRRPAVWMPWLPGRPMNLVVEDLLTDQLRIEVLAHRVLEMLAELRAADVAHGDLQNGNLLVDDDLTVRLVDLDGVWVPSLSGSPPDETGHMCFQHPRRDSTHWGPGIDSFSGLLIYTSLVALAYDPELWSYHQGENLVLGRADLEAPGATPPWSEMLGSPSGLVRALTGVLIEQAQAAHPPDVDVAEVVARHAPPAESTMPRRRQLRPQQDEPAEGRSTVWVESEPLSVEDSEWWSPSGDATPSAAPAPAAGSSTAPLMPRRPIWAVMGSSTATVAVVSGVLATASAALALRLYAGSDPTPERIDYAAVVLLVVFGSALVGSVNGLPALTARAWSRALRDVGAGTLAGCAATLWCLVIIDTALPNSSSRTVQLSLGVVALMWMLLGISLGIATGVGKSWRSALVGGVAGTAGALASSILFIGQQLELGPGGALVVDRAELPLLFATIMVSGMVIAACVLVAQSRTAPVKFTIESGPLRGRGVLLEKAGRVTIGSGSNCQLALRDDWVVAREHASVAVEGSRVTLTPATPLEVNSVSTVRPVVLVDGDHLVIGSTEVRVHINAGAL